jgi:hypothetical protein
MGVPKQRIGVLERAFLCSTFYSFCYHPHQVNARSDRDRGIGFLIVARPGNIMAILVTGGTGFVGLNVVEALVARGDEVVVFDRGALPAVAERMFESRRARLEVINGDVLDQARLAEVVRSRNIGRIVHCAAITSGRARSRRPGAIVDVNAGHGGVLNAARLWCKACRTPVPVPTANPATSDSYL